MSLSVRGTTASAVEVNNISQFGIWLLAGDRELFLPYEQFPWFKDQPVRVILNVEKPSPGHFYWPDIDVDLTEEIIDHPERFPKIAGCSADLRLRTPGSIQVYSSLLSNGQVLLLRQG